MDSARLSVSVMEWMAKGWQPLGGVSVAIAGTAGIIHTYAQAMVKYA